MKGTINIEFIVAVFVFLFTIAFIIISIINNVRPLHDNYNADFIVIYNYQISDILLFDAGAANDGTSNWNENNVERIGLSNGKIYILDKDKITSLQTLCQTNYRKIKNLFGQRADIIIKIGNQTTELLNCQPPTQKLYAPAFSSTRYAVYDYDNGIIQVNVTTVL